MYTLLLSSSGDLWSCAGGVCVPGEGVRSTLRLINDTSPYGLTGSVFACNRDKVRKIMDILQHAAGYFYINDKSTGSVLG